MNNKFFQAYSKYKEGKFFEAKKICLDILNNDSQNYNCYNLLGLIEANFGNFDKSIEYYLKSISLNPNSEHGYNNYALSLKAKGLFEDALKNFDIAISLKKDFIEALLNKANLLFFLKRFDDAIHLYNEILKIKKTDLVSLNNLGLIYLEKKNYDKALDYFNIAYSYHPENFMIVVNKSNTLKKLKRFKESLSILENAYHLNQKNLYILVALANSHDDLKQYEESLNYYNQALTLKKNDIYILYNKANVLKKIKDFNQSLSLYDLVLEIDPNFVEALNNKAELLEHMQEYEKALNCYDNILRISPNNYEVRYNRSLLLIRLGRFKEGWLEHEFRWNTQLFKNQKRTLQHKLLPNLNEAKSKDILILDEQGLGDTIQFVRYAPFLQTQSKKIFFETPKNLLDLFRNSFPEISFFEKGNKLPDHDRYIYLMSLAFIFKSNLKNIPSTKKYITPESEKIKKTEGLLGVKKKPRVGIAWSGNPNNPKEHIRSIDISTFSKILQLDFDFYCLQKDFTENDETFIKKNKRIKVIKESLENFSETSALCSFMDLIISVDTSIAHLAGAMGKKTWLLLSYNPDYRWLMDKKKCIWYESVELYRQEKNNSWDIIFDKVYSDLKSLLN